MWKANEEVESKSYYVKKSGSRIRGTATCRYFFCNRSGFYNPKGVGERSLKSQGSSKAQTICPANMIVKEEITSGVVHVIYYSTHYGHEKDIAHLKIPHTVRLNIAAKLQQGVTMERVLDDIRDNVVSEFGREHLINCQDIRNVLSQYNIRGIEKHANDHSSVCAWVTELKSLDYNPVLYFKQQGLQNEDMGKDDFLLCIQTEFQHEMLKAFGHNVICVDATHGTNAYDFLLITVLVIDDFGEGVPVAWAISNKEDATTLATFFKHLKCKSGDIKPTYFMSDDAQAYWNAWSSIFGVNDTKKFLCSWHVDRAWRKALQEHVSDKEERALVYYQLCLLHDETDEVVFSGLHQQFLSYILANHTRFFQYFKNTYAMRCGQWVACYRKGTIVNTNMHLEAFHRLLKKVYLEGKHNRRLDNLLSILVRVARDKTFEQLNKVHKGKFSYRASELNRRHKKAKDSGVVPTMKSDTMWEVPSQSNGHALHIVELQDHICACKLQCGACKVCAYLYSCTCVDYALHNTACKHIHVVHATRKGPPAHEVQCDTSCSSDGTQMQADVSDRHLQSIVQKEKNAHKLLVNRANEVILLAKSVDNVQSLQTAARHLTSAISVLKSQQKRNPIPETFECRKRPAPNSCMDKHLRFYSTKKKRKTSVSSVSISKPTVEQSNHAKDTLDDTDIILCSVCLKEDDNELTDNVEWMKCDYCNVWLHMSCAIDNKYCKNCVCK